MTQPQRPSPGTSRSAAIAVATFGATFLVGLILVGETAGSFAEPDDYFPRHYASGQRQLADLIAAVLWLIAAAALLAFIRLSAPPPNTTIRGQLTGAVFGAAGTLAAVGLLIAATGFATVPASIIMGEAFGDPGIVEGQALPPQLGYVAFVVAVIAAAVTIALAPAITPWRPWPARSCYLLAVLTLIGAPAVAPAFLLAPCAVLAAIELTRRPQTPQPTR